MKKELAVEFSFTGMNSKRLFVKRKFRGTSTCQIIEGEQLLYYFLLDYALLYHYVN